MHLFYTPHIDQSHELSEDESLHAVKVLRLTEGTPILLIDGKGGFYKAIITRAHHKRCAFEVTEHYEQPQLWKGKIHIAVAPTKNLDRMEWFLEKSTEIGLDQVSFLKCRYSERKDIKLERMQKIVLSATKQSMKSKLPVLEGMIDFKTFVTQDFPGQKFIAHCYDEQSRVLYQDAYEQGSDVVVLIGPEGDFSEQEVALAIENGFKPISLGLSRLRTETAALVACHTVHVIN